MMLDKLHDARVNCTSILTRLPVGRFIALVENVYENRGGIDGQRAPLRTKTAISIRSRMVRDLKEGAVIPPIVIGVHAEPASANALAEAADHQTLISIIEAIPPEQISIIDGMQRTTALLEAVAENFEVDSHDIRVEFWVSENLNSLIYRMLVLNTGQVPWEVARQLETVYSQLLAIIRSEIGADADIFSRDEFRRRSEAGQYQASSIIRLFLAFSSRRAEFDLKDRVAEDFARLDAVEASAHEEFLDLYIRTLKLVTSLDKAFARGIDIPKEPSRRIADGKEIFQSFPALVGFFVAVAIQLFDQPGFEVDWTGVEDKMQQVEASVKSIVDRLSSLNPEQVDDFLQLDLLNDRLGQRSGQVGRFERDLFIRAFEVLIKNADRLSDMTPCWRA